MKLDVELYKEKLTERTLECIQQAIDMLEEGDQICALNYYVMNDPIVTIIIESVDSKNKSLDKIQRSMISQYEGHQLCNALEEWSSVNSYYGEFASIGSPFEFDESFFGRQFIDHEKAELVDYVISSLEAQKDLKGKKLMQNPKVAGLFETSISIEEGPGSSVVLNTIIRKDNQELF
ncbi:MAG: hypothetical protein NE328_21755 [Lentisphaeraceae bacterium]|nr:hypothetical protein [Lentisphaeraceae bacterium]